MDVIMAHNERQYIVTFKTTKTTKYITKQCGKMEQLLTLP